VKRSLFIIVPVLTSLLTLLLAEGIYSIAHWKSADRSIVYKTYRLLTKLTPNDAQPELRLASRGEFEALIPDMLKAGAGLGNSPYKELKNEQAAINTRTVDGCRFSKPFLDKEITHLRTAEFELFDPPAIFYDRAAELGAPLQAFIEKYATRRLSYRTNGQGERLTFPAIEAQDKVFVAGDSVANGAMVSDDETLSSALQQRDATRQYVNLGASGNSAEDNLCNLAAAAKRYRGQIKELVYVYCENDFELDKPYGEPEDVVAWLEDYAKREGITKVTITYAPYIYNVVPHLTRFRGYRGEGRPTHHAEAERLRMLSGKAGFGFIDIAELAQREIQDSGTDFAAFSLFVDLLHLSPYGAGKLADALLGRSS